MTRHVINIILNTYSFHNEIKDAGVKAMQVTCGFGDIPLEKACFLIFQKQAAKGKTDPDRMQQPITPLESTYRLLCCTISTPLLW